MGPASGFKRPFWMSRSVLPELSWAVHCPSCAATSRYKGVRGDEAGNADCVTRQPHKSLEMFAEGPRPAEMDEMFE